jgi:transcriptional regulator with XRE-family HTH domain
MAGSIGSEREFMDALRALRARSGLSYRDLARRMSLVAPQHAVSKSTLASLFAQDALPRRRGQLAALVSVLVLELDEPAEETSQYLEAWSRLMTARSATATSPAVRQQSQPAAPPARQAQYWQPRYRAPEPAAPVQSPREYRAQGARRLLILLAGLSAIAFIFWAALPPGGISFWLVWILFSWPAFLGALFLLGSGPGYERSNGPELPADYLRAEYRSRPGPRR